MIGASPSGTCPQHQFLHERAGDSRRGELTFADGISVPGRYVEMRAEMDVLVLISNCPQLNNPCNAYNPTPIRDPDLGAG